jgi:hypothetical protein
MLRTGIGFDHVGADLKSLQQLPCKTRSEHLKTRGRKAGVPRLRNIQKDLMAHPIAASKILDEITGIDTRRNRDKRIVACILGVGAEC